MVWWGTSIGTVILILWTYEIAGDSVLSARCQARCLNELLHSGTQKERKQRKTDGSMEECLHKSQCLSCVKPCNTRPSHITTCSVQCQPEEEECRESCEYLKLYHTIRVGVCPRPGSATGFAAACVTSCHKDGDCPNNDKCCSNACGFTCQTPVLYNQALPALPINITSEERRNGRALKLRWILPGSGQSRYGPIVYVVEMRSVVSVKPDWGSTRPWRLVRLTQDKHTLIRDISAGHWYQFRIAAVSNNGTRGFSQETLKYKSSRVIQRPTQPENLRQGASTLHDGKVDLEILWDPPRRSDLPVSRYAVYWSERLKSIKPVLVRIDVLRKSVRGDHHSFVIKRLKPGTTYFVQVEAIVQHGNKRLQSTRTSQYLVTYAPPDHSAENPFDTFIPFHPQMVEVWNLTVGRPFYQHGVIKALLSWMVEPALKSEVDKYMIYWSPGECQQYSQAIIADATTHDLSFEIYDLQFDCEYVIKVMSVNSDGVQGGPSAVTLHVAQCLDIPIKGTSKTPECPDRALKPPRKPPDILHKVFLEDCEISINIMWKLPHSDLPVEYFQVTWGITQPYKNSPSNHGNRSGVPVVYSSPPQQQNVSSTSLQYSIQYVEEGQLYLVQVQAVSEVGIGQSSCVEIWTPAMESCITDTSLGMSVVVTQSSVRRDDRGNSVPSHNEGTMLCTHQLVYFCMLIFCILIQICMTRH